MKEWKETEKEQKVIAFPYKNTYDEETKGESHNQPIEPSGFFSLPYGLIGLGGFFLTMLGHVLTGLEPTKLELMIVLAAWLVAEVVVWRISKLIYMLFHRNRKSSDTENSKNLSDSTTCQKSYRFSA